MQDSIHTGSTEITQIERNSEKKQTMQNTAYQNYPRIQSPYDTLSGN